MTNADLIALASGAVAVAALLVAVYAIVRSNRNSSAATVVALNEHFRQAWQWYFDEREEDKKDYQFAELANLLEVACGIHDEGSYGIRLISSAPSAVATNGNRCAVG